VFSVERIKELALRSRKILEELNYKNVVILNRDGSCGLPEFSPYQGIIVTAAAPEIPEPMIEQLADGGRLVIPKGNRFTQILLVVEKRGNELLTTEAEECVFVPLIGKYGWEDDSCSSRHFT
jgi:protein-L-isoaspartate(D-aspartate) O-methyltransferase